jgi:hypothetical protein
MKYLKRFNEIHSINESVNTTYTVKEIEDILEEKLIYTE